MDCDLLWWSRCELLLWRIGPEGTAIMNYFKIYICTPFFKKDGWLIPTRPRPKHTPWKDKCSRLSAAWVCSQRDLNKHPSRVWVLPWLDRLRNGGQYLPKYQWQIIHGGLNGMGAYHRVSLYPSAAFGGDNSMDPGHDSTTVQLLTSYNGFLQ